MAIGALMHPGLWSDQSDFLEYRIIPAVEGPAISLNRALNLAGNGKMLAGDSANPLSRAFRQLEHPVLDLGDSIFSGLIRLIPGVIDLNLIRDLKAGQTEGNENMDLNTLLEKANRIISKSRNKIPECLISPGLNHQDLWNVRFPTSPKLGDRIRNVLFPGYQRRRTGLPRQFVALNPKGEWIRSLVRLSRQNPSLALFRFLKRIISQTRLTEREKSRLLKKISLTLLREESAL
jgi:hypothetical protein